MTGYEQEKALVSGESLKISPANESESGDPPHQISNAPERTGGRLVVPMDPNSNKDEKQNDPPSSTDKPEPPNGGIVAWTQCFGVFCLWFAVWGLVNSSGTCHRPRSCPAERY
jgi:hypothetical protein